MTPSLSRIRPLLFSRLALANPAIIPSVPALFAGLDDQPPAHVTLLQFIPCNAVRIWS